MLILNPRQVTFGAATWSDVTAIVFDRHGTRVVVDHTDQGPHATFADVPEQRTQVKVVMELVRGDIQTPRPGESATLSFFTSPTSSDAARRKVTMTAVVTNVSHELSLKRGALRTITLVAVSSNGATDPVSIANAN